MQKFFFFLYPVVQPIFFLKVAQFDLKSSCMYLELDH